MARDARLEAPPPTPCVVVHGDVNALSIVRSLGRRGVPVHVLNDAGSYVSRSRHATPLTVPDDGRGRGGWADHLLGPECEGLSGAVLLACSDAALRMLAARREELSARYVLDLGVPEVQLRMLDKRASLEVARDAGIGHPRFWTVDGPDEVAALSEQLPYPVIVKPVDTHRFMELTGRKMIVADGAAQLLAAMAAVHGEGMEFVLVEEVPGPDDQLCSYYTYLDEVGEPQFHFTKRVIRRFPTGQGRGCYHVTAWDEAVAEAGLRYLQAAGVRGLGNVEFKLDRRDGELKFIECNARFTGGNPLVTAAGMDLGVYVYERLTTGSAALPETFRDGLRLWHAVLDLRTMLDLRRRGEISVGSWVRSVLHPQILPWFAADDPGPSAAVARDGLRSLARRVRSGAAAGSTAAPAAGRR